MNRITFLAAVVTLCSITLKSQQWVSFSKSEPTAPQLNILSSNTQTVSFEVTEVYNTDDKEGLRIFLRQPSNAAGKINGQMLGLQLSDTLNWQTQEEWVGKIENLYWNEDSPKRLVAIGWTDVHLAGNLNCSRWTYLTNLDCSSNRLTQLDVGNCLHLTQLHCMENLLTALDVTTCGNLNDLFCYSNQLTSLDVSNSSELEQLVCNNNMLTTLNIGCNTHLRTLSCSSNKLAMLDVSNHTNMERLYCNNNMLITLTVSSFTHLWDLNCVGNRLLFSELPLNPDAMNTYEYSPQQIIDGGSIDYKTVIDLSTEYSIAGNITQFSWFDITGENEQPLELTGENGKFALTKDFINKRLRCKMINTNFPNFSGDSALVYEIAVIGNVGIGRNPVSECGITISPNPTAGELRIESGVSTALNNKNLRVESVQIFDVFGKIAGTYNDVSTIDISHLSAGVYFVQITTESRIVTNKIIKY